MKIKTTVLTLTMFFLALAPLTAQDKTPKKYSDQVLQKTAIMEPVLALEARYWAHQIAVLRNGTYEEREKNSKSTPYTEEYEAKFLAALKKNLETKNYKPLTAAELKKLDEAKLELRKINFPAEFKKGLERYLDNADCLDLDARYWAFYIQADFFTFDEIISASAGWPGNKERNEVIVGKIKEMINKGEPVILKSYEKYIMPACTRKFSDLPPPASDGSASK